jgi:hypothetical protein
MCVFFLCFRHLRKLCVWDLFFFGKGENDEFFFAQEVDWEGFEVIEL